MDDEAFDECNDYEVEQDFDQNIDDLEFTWGDSGDADANNVSVEGSASNNYNKRCEQGSEAETSNDLDGVSESDVSKNVEDKQCQLEISLPTSFVTFESFLFSFPTEATIQNELINGLNSMLVKNVSSNPEFIQNTISSILIEIVNLITDSLFETQLNYCDCSAKHIECVSSDRAMFTFEIGGQNIFSRYFACGDLVRVAIDNFKTFAIIRNLEEQVVNDATGEVRLIISVETTVSIQEFFNKDKSIVQCAPLNTFRKYLLQMKQMFAKETEIVREQFVHPKFDIAASGILVGNIKQSVYDNSEMEGIQKAVDTISSPSTAFCCIDYRNSKKDAERISRIVDEICVQFILLENELIMTNPNLNGNPVDGTSSEKHRLVVATVEALPIIDITSYLRDCGLRIYHVTDSVCAIPSEEQVIQRAIELLEEKINDADEKSEEEDLTSVKKCLSFFKGENTNCEIVIREQFKQKAKLEFLKSSDLIIGTIEELSNNEILSMGLRKGLRFRTAIMNEASQVTQLELLSLTYLGTQKFILVDNKLVEGSVMHLLMSYYQNNYSTIEKGAKCSVVTDWQPPKPVNSSESAKRKREHGGYRDLKDYSNRRDHRQRHPPPRYHNQSRFLESRSPHFNKRPRREFSDSYRSASHVSNKPSHFPSQVHQHPLSPHPSSYRPTWGSANNYPQQRFRSQQQNMANSSTMVPNHNIRPGGFTGFQNRPPIPNVHPSFTNSTPRPSSAVNRSQSMHSSRLPSQSNTIRQSFPNTPVSSVPFRVPFNVSRGAVTHRAPRPSTPRFGTPRPNPTGPHRLYFPYSQR